MKILILYSELAGYTLACLRRLLQDYPVELHLIRWPVNAEAPFNFDFGDQVKVKDRAHLNQADLDREVKDFEPDGIFVSGWMDKGYVQALRQKPHGCPVICGLDNQWTGNLRQRVATVLSPWLIKKHFDYIWAAGPRQADYARRLGFLDSQVRTGYYSADVERFAEHRAGFLPKGKRTLLYVGRIMAHKGIAELIQAFLRLNHPDWELKLVGKPDGTVDIPIHPKIIHEDFVQPNLLPPLLASAHAFALPSQSEPWGVALHEAAACGLPLIASTACGAADAFIDPGENGWLFQAGDGEDLAQVLRKLFDLPEAEWKKFGHHSQKLAQQITPKTWATTLYQLIQDHRP